MDNDRIAQLKGHVDAVREVHHLEGWDSWQNMYYRINAMYICDMTECLEAIEALKQSRANDTDRVHYTNAGRSIEE